MGEVYCVFDVICVEVFVVGFEVVYCCDFVLFGFNICVNYEMGVVMSLFDCVWVQGEQMCLFCCFQQLYVGYDLIFLLIMLVLFFLWSELYLKEVNGVLLENYYCWLVLIYVVILVINFLILLFCGCDYCGMFFGLQVIGVFCDDVCLLVWVGVLEVVFVGDEILQWLWFDLVKLKFVNVVLIFLVIYFFIFDGVVMVVVVQVVV